MNNYYAGKKTSYRILAEVISYVNPVFGAHQANGYRENGNGVCLLWPFLPFWPNYERIRLPICLPNFFDFLYFLFFLGVLKVSKIFFLSTYKYQRYAFFLSFLAEGPLKEMVHVIFKWFFWRKLLYLDVSYLLGVNVL